MPNTKKFNTIQEVINEISLTPSQKDTEIILLGTNFSRPHQMEMFRLLRALVAENERTLHYHCNNYLKYLLDSANGFFSNWDGLLKEAEREIKKDWQDQPTPTR